MKWMAERASILRRLVALVIVALIAWPAGPASAQAGRDVYIKGLEHLDAKRWAEAIQAFDAALQADPKENKGTRLYGMRYGYFPYRDKGVALYNLGRYDEAVAALEESLRQGVTPEATRTIDLARNRTPAVAVAQVFRGPGGTTTSEASSIPTPAPGRPPSRALAPPASSATRKTAPPGPMASPSSSTSRSVSSGSRSIRTASTRPRSRRWKNPWPPF